METLSRGKEKTVSRNGEHRASSFSAALYALHFPNKKKLSCVKIPTTDADIYDAQRLQPVYPRARSSSRDASVYALFCSSICAALGQSGR